MKTYLLLASFIFATIGASARANDCSIQSMEARVASISDSNLLQKMNYCSKDFFSDADSERISLKVGKNCSLHGIAGYFQHIAFDYLGKTIISSNDDRYFYKPGSSESTGHIMSIIRLVLEDAIARGICDEEIGK